MNHRPLAAECVQRHALDDADAAVLLEMLGLAEPVSASPRRTRTEKLVQVVAAADRLIHLRELRSQLGWSDAAVNVAASVAARAGKLARPKTGWYGLPGRDYPDPDTNLCGTLTGYNRGCHCADCRATAAEDCRRRRARYRAERIKVDGRLVAITAPSHGLNTARAWGCQCSTCAEASRLYSLKRRQQARVSVNTGWQEWSL